MINVNLHTNLCKYEKDDLNHPFLYKTGEIIMRKQQIFLW